jgi:hypothetical protein
MLEHDQTRFSHRHATAITHQQVLVQLDLELAHMAAQQGLRHVQGQRSFGETAQFGHADKGFDLFEFHRVPNYE